MSKILVTPHMLVRQTGPFRTVLEDAGLEVVFPPEGVNTLQPEVIKELLTRDIHGMLASTEPLSREILAGSGLTAIARLGVGYDSIDIPAATELGIAVTITPGVLEASVAEQTLAMLLAISRGIIERDREVREGNWTRAALPRLAGKTFGIVGLGRIGRAVVKRIQALEMKVIAFDPTLDDATAAELGVIRCTEVMELIEQADVVSLHCPCTPATRNLIDRDALKRMKPTAILLNLGRGGIVDEDALAQCLHDGHLLGAALDVFATEPLPLDSPLLQAPRLLLATHMGGIDEDSAVLGSRLAAKCLSDLFQGTWPEPCIVNPDVQPQWKWPRTP